MMYKRAIALFAAAAMICMAPVASHAITPYSQDFEGLNQADTGALAADGWLVFGNVFDSGGNYLYGYGVFPAPNDGGAFCAIASGEGGAAQGAQQLVVFSDYNNADHGNGNLIEALVFQERVIEAGDVDETWTFDFQAKLGNLAGATTAVAFIKTLDPANGYATTNYLPVDMTNTPTTWTDYSITLLIDAGLVGQLIQIGFASTATNYEGSGVFYDNINFYASDPVSIESRSFGEVKSLFR